MIRPDPQQKDLQTIIGTREKAVKEKEEKKKQELAKLEKHKKLVSERLAKERVKREESQQQRQLLVEFGRRAEVQGVLARHRKQLRHVFLYYSRLDDLEITNTLSQSISTLDLSKLSKLCLQFKIVPLLMPADDVVHIFRQATKSKAVASKETGKMAEKETQILEYNVRPQFSARTSKKC